MRKFLFMAATLIAFTMPAQASHNGTEHPHDITVSVHGLVCDFCAQAIEKVFMDHGEVEHVDVDLDNFEVTIDLKDGASLDDETVTKLITDSGYTVNGITRDAEG